MDEIWDEEASMPSMDINVQEPRGTHSRARTSIRWARTHVASTGQICLRGMSRKGDYKQPSERMENAEEEGRSLTPMAGWV